MADFATVVADGPGFIRISIGGPYTWTRVDRLLRRVVAESESRRIRCVLLDVTAVPVKLSTRDKYTMGVDVALRVGGRVEGRVAGVSCHHRRLRRDGGPESRR